MTGVKARATMEAAVRRELFGPPADEMPRGKPLDCSSGAIHFKKREDSWGLWHEESSKEEILSQSDPLRRYGVGVLFNGAAANRTSALSEASEAMGDDRDEIAGVTGLSVGAEILAGPPVAIDVMSTIAPPGQTDSDDFDLADANSFKPSAMAISFQCDVPQNCGLAVTVTGAYYDRISVDWPGLRRSRTWWVRRPFHLVGTVSSQELMAETNRLKTIKLHSNVTLRIAPTLQVFSRPVPRRPVNSTLRLVTMAVLNTAPGRGPSSAIFQMGFGATPQNGLRITPYPDMELHEPDEEEQSIALLYRKQRTYAIGHGCAAEWVADEQHSASAVFAEPLPAYEVVSLTPNVYVLDENGKRRAVTVSMEELANGGDVGRDQVDTVLHLYDEWIAMRQEEVGELAPQFQAAARCHIQLCKEALQRMRIGWQLATSDPIARRAFRLANEAMLYQQLRSSFERRKVERQRDGRLVVTSPHPEPQHTLGKGNWRPFQIAFLLASLPELIDRTLPSRSIVDLIFFPTGGGKTEAYLGASAISLLARRLRDADDVGTDTLMRYTLRLLTAQQFLRAAALVCVLEDIRSKNEDELGETPFGIGIWLGSSSTPNNWVQAVENWRQLGNDYFAQNKFLLLRCPWCGTEMGPKPKPKRGQDIIGYQLVGKKVEFRCIDTACRFGGRRKLPIHVVDQDIYDTQPSIVIGTVDKFAMMAWRPEARALFGLADDGTRRVSPPGLIIQDELHLISGPLGSMVGLYEPVIDDLCTDKRGAAPVPPKIIASTATIRRYEDQIRGLFGREQVALFPPQGLDEGHSFFAEPATLENGELEPGRRYLGVMSASLGSTQTVQVRVAAATLQGAVDLPDADKDGYWTNLNFLNSLRELGNTVSLIQSDIPDYLAGLSRREGIQPRWPRIPMELTSRRRSDDIPKAIEQLQMHYGEPGCVDICLASNIIEVGIDIDRLGLMTIVGQPKTTAQYIQVSGRVGRRPECPGLVITIYGAAKPRDRSHYERFRTYHQQLYAQVEPTSVTPFAAPVLKRALHAAVVSHIRQASECDLPVYPFPSLEYDTAVELLEKRAKIADPSELPTLEREQKKRANEWEKWERTSWSANVSGGDPKQGLMRYAGTLPDLSASATMWDIPTSMRNVDAECRLEISLDYNLEDVATAEGGDQ
ncbi:helicase [Nocardia uniformis]|uniref:Helicase n=1 Tax=Nocardia uniformis TaxID=53432 RepID=A0A849CFI4_9NOCA|nr:helicase-related protein [Nocardia uniformis]NNH75580.1 helicase [Nocardia uniformis]